MDMEAVAKRIRDARVAQHLTQEDLAAKADISLTHMGVIERAAKVPSLTTFVAIANALNMSADSLLLDVVNKSAEQEATLLGHMVSQETPEQQRKILKVVEVLLEKVLIYMLGINMEKVLLTPLYFQIIMIKKIN